MSSASDCGQAPVAAAQEVRAHVRRPRDAEHPHGAQHGLALGVVVAEVGELRGARRQAALEDVPQPLLALAPADADAPADPQHLQQPRDRLARGHLVGPPAVAPRLGRAVLELAGAQRAALAQLGDDVVGEARVGVEELAHADGARAVPANVVRIAQRCSGRSALATSDASCAQPSNSSRRS